ncbi:conjugative transposon protein TraM [Galbibacter sp. BG1]|uniref:conjugative transposon protein TraM n=1 Tax=Galbibacter sp. BG1 TaxID=1170699 RepID=UPI0015B88BBC|nr:conjugative transposon protein TraM [Galbibacter sp. BG1]QLE02009.1 conjugative transposon protein TraM [Galbibacter sp. BG1]
MELLKDKKKLVFMAMVLCTLLFIGAYGLLYFGDSKEPQLGPERLLVPKVEGEPDSYGSRLEAVEALEEEQQTEAPSPYQNRYIDSLGYYDPQLMDKKKKRMIDSVYELGVKRYERLQEVRSYDTDVVKNETIVAPVDTIKVDEKNSLEINLVSVEELGLAHELFFASNPIVGKEGSENGIVLEVDGTQTVKAKERLQMRLKRDVQVHGQNFKKDTRVYGTVTFQPNRVLLKIEYINHDPIGLEAYDFQDGLKGIYIRNSFRSDAKREVLGDMIEDVNIAGVPQINGLKRIFQRSNRNVRVTVHDGYRLLLK